MPDFSGSPNFASARAIQSDVRARSVSGQHLLPEDTLFEWDDETGKIFVQGTTNELMHSGDFPSDTGWTTTTSLLNGWTGTVKYIRRAGWVIVTLATVNGSGATSPTLLNLPSGYEPSTTVYSAAVGYDSTDVPLFMVALTTGEIQVSGDGSDNGSIAGQITYPV